MREDEQVVKRQRVNNSYSSTILPMLEENNKNKLLPLNINFAELRSLCEKTIKADNETINDNILSTLSLIEKSYVTAINSWIIEEPTLDTFLETVAATLEVIINKVNTFEMLSISLNVIQKSTLNKIKVAIKRPCEQLKETVLRHINERNEPQNDLVWQTHSLHCEQDILISNLEINEKLEAVLISINHAIKDSPDANPSCFISYAWPTEENKKYEYWLQPFLKVLRHHLRLAGIYAILDIVDNKPGCSIYQFMEQAETSSFVLLICTESLLDKHRKNYNAICTELSHIAKKAEDDDKRNLTRVFPILLSGKHGISYPVQYKLYSTVRDLRGKSYIENLKAIIGWIYQNDIESKLTEFTRQYSQFVDIMPKRQILQHLQTYDYYKQQEAIKQEEAYQNLSIMHNISESRYQKPPVIWNIPRQNDYFTGRDQYITKLFNNIENDALCSIVGEEQIMAIAGLGGIGKTQLVKQYAHLNKYNYQIIWWFDAKGNLDAQYKELATKIDKAFLLDKKIVLDTENYLARIREDVKNALRQLNDWLLIFDNAEMNSEFYTYIPQQHTNTRGHILITSRDASWMNTLKLANFLEEEAINYIKKVLKAKYEEQQAKILARLLNYFPLALTRAVTYIDKMPTMNIANYIKLYEERHDALLKREDNFQKKYQSSSAYDNYSFTLETALDLSIQEVKKNPIALNLLFFCSLLHSEEISEALLNTFILEENYDKDFDFNEGMSELIKYSIVEKSTNSYSIHEMIQKNFRDKIKLHYEHPIIIKSFEKFIRCTLNTLGITNNILSQITEITGMNNQIIKDNFIYNNHFYSLLNNIQSYLGKNFYEFINDYSKNNKLNLVTFISSLAYSYCDIHQFKQAHTYIKIVKESFDKNITTDIENTAYIYQIIGAIYQNTGDFDNALSWYNKSLEENKKIESIGLISIYITLGTLYLSLKFDYEKALEYLEEAKRLFEKENRSEYNYFYAEILKNIGKVYREKNQSKEACFYFNEQLNVLQKTGYNKNSRAFYTAYIEQSINHSLLARTKNDFNLAFEEAEFAYQGLKLLYGDNHLRVSYALFAKAKSLVGIDKINEAVECIKLSLNIAKNIYKGYLHPILAVISDELANIYLINKENAKALKYFIEAKKIFINFILKEDHEKIIEIENKINKCEKAISFKQALSL